MAIKFLSHSVIIFNLRRTEEIPQEELHETSRVQVPENIVLFSGDETIKIWLFINDVLKLIYRHCDTHS